MSIVLDGTAGITSPGGDTATISIRSPIIGAGSGSALNLQANATTYATITTTGTVGVGTTTPHTGAALWAGFSAIEMFSNWGSFSSSGNGPYVTANAYWDGAIGWKSSNGTKQPAQMLIGNGGYAINAANSIPAADALVNFVSILGSSYNNTTTLQGGTSSAGTGIAFPATQSASSDANCLDDYEEGTWTPSLGGNTTYSIQQGSYTKVGRMVYLNFDISVTTLGTGSAVTFSGMPFASVAGTSNAGSIAYFTGTATSCYSMILRNDAGGALLNIYPQNTQSTAIGGGSVFTNGARVIGSITYQTA